MIHNIIQGVPPLHKAIKLKSNQYELPTNDKPKDTSSTVTIDSKSKTKETEYTNKLLPFIELADEFRIDKIIEIKEKIKSSFYDNTDNWIDSLLEDLS